MDSDNIQGKWIVSKIIEILGLPQHNGNEATQRNIDEWAV